MLFDKLEFLIDGNGGLADIDGDTAVP